MVRFEDRFEGKRESTEQRLVSPDFPIIANENTGAVLNESPNSLPVEVSFCIQGESMWMPGLRDPQCPVEGVRKPASRE
jgi:hypothetical protein